MKKDNSKATMLVISMGFLFLYIAFSWHWAAIVSFIIGVTGALSSFVSQKFEWLWMKFADILGFVIPNILLSLVFYLLLFPVSLLARIFNKDPLMLSREYKSHFIDINKDTEKSSFEKTW